MTQTAAIFLDAYRELNSKRLFWITMILSGLVVAAFALVGINENGLHIIAWDLNLPGLNSTVIKPETFYKLMFTNLGINLWLAWIATVLALVSTAGIFPDFISAGSIDLVLSKPIGRFRLFLTKYATGLLFVGLQVSVFAFASFFVLGIKGGTWEPGVFLAIPVVVVFFSYLYCMCVLLGMITRSTIASLLLTVLMWFVLFAINVTEQGLLTGQVWNRTEIASVERLIARNEAAIERLKARGDEIDFDVASAPLRTLIDRDKADLESKQKAQRTLDLAHTIAMGVKTVMPKTAETVDLLERWLVDLAELPSEPEDIINMEMETDPRISGDNAPSNARRRGGGPRNGADPDQIARETQEELRSRSVWWVMGTSLVFEVFVLLIAAWLFCRRDY